MVKPDFTGGKILPARLISKHAANTLAGGQVAKTQRPLVSNGFLFRGAADSDVCRLSLRPHEFANEHIHDQRADDKNLARF